MPAPRYVERALSASQSQPRFLHLGHWEEPALAETSLSGLSAAQARLNDRLLEMAGIEDGMAVLDVGCGLGGTVAVINERHRELSIVGVNHDDRQLEVARQVTAANGNAIEWRAHRVCPLPAPLGSFDRVVCVEALFHFDSRRQFFAEASRVLRPGGRLVISDLILRPDTRAKVPAAAIQAAIEAGAGPWPDLWGRDADHEGLARTAGLEALVSTDATAATLPSYACFAAGRSSGRTSTDPVDVSTETLGWLQAQGYLEVIYRSFAKTGPGSQSVDR